MKNIVENQDIKTDKAEMEGLRNQLAAVVAERDALAAENVELKQSEREFDKTCAEEFGPDWFSELTETPATDAAVCGFHAEGVEKFALMLAEEAIKDNSTTGWKSRASRAASEYAELLRESEHSQEVERG